MEEQELHTRLSAIERELTEIRTWTAARMPAQTLEHEFTELVFQTKQLISIMQGTRDDLVLMRADIRRLANLLEQTLRARALDDEWKAGDPDRRMSSIPDRRRAS